MTQSRARGGYFSCRAVMAAAWLVAYAAAASSLVARVTFIAALAMVNSSCGTSSASGSVKVGND